MVQQNGLIRIVKNDVVLAASFYKDANDDADSEHGCLGAVADPGFANNRFVYLFCTVRNATGVNNRVLRVTEADDRAVAGSERVILDLPNAPAGNPVPHGRRPALRRRRQALHRGWQP